MKFIHKFDRYVSVIFILSIILIMATSYFTFKEVITLHNKRQQEAIIPLFSLITSEVIRPLSVAKYMATDLYMLDYLQQDKIDKSKVLNYLQIISKQYKMLTFVAIEKHNLLLDASETETLLTSDQPEWFHRLKAIDKLQFTDIGNLNDPHMYFDVKIYNPKEEFLGFVGAAIDLDYFAKQFSAFYQRFGVELIFVDEDDVIILSSTDLMKTDSHHRKDEQININSLPWYDGFKKAELENNNQPISSIEYNENIISTMPIQELNWQIYIISPPTAKQAEYWQLFISKFSLFVLIPIILYFILRFALNLYKTHLVKDSETDYLTKLPTRRFLYWQFTKLHQQFSDISVVIADIDHFKQINDDYGHLKGDDVLKVIAGKLNESLRQQDLIARWGGEEFILLFPGTSEAQAQEIAERIRVKIEQIVFKINSNTNAQSNNAANANIQNNTQNHPQNKSPSKKNTFSTTMSFGICYSTLKDKTLNELFNGADKALYQAKENGRNQVIVHS